MAVLCSAVVMEEKTAGARPVLSPLVTIFPAVRLSEASMMTPVSWMTLPPVPFHVATALSVDEAGPVTVDILKFLLQMLIWSDGSQRNEKELNKI
jgi:hypothetical protein